MRLPMPISLRSSFPRLKVKKVIQGHGGHRANKARVAIQDQRETQVRQERLAQMQRLPVRQLP